MPEVTAIIPVAPYHADLLSRAIASVEAQTVPCLTLHMFDKDSQGPGVLRNRMLQSVTTPLVIFLDADDWIAPDFVEKTMAVIHPKRYVYTDWVTGEDWRTSPEKAWCGGTWHPITSLLWTHDVKRVGGFDESLKAQEDTDFYLKLVTQFICGIHLSEPLFFYGSEGQRAAQSVTSGQYLINQELLKSRYGGKMGCCGDNQEQSQQYPLGTKQPGDVLAQAQWHGNRAEYGRATGRRYNRMAYPKTTWVHPHDVVAKEDHWTQVIEPAVDDPYRFDNGAKFATAMVGGREKAPVVEITDAPMTETYGFPEGGFRPDVEYIVETAKKKLTQT